MFTIKTFSSLLVSAALLLGVGCDKKDDKATVAPTPAKEVRIGYFANLTHAQAVLGVASGDFERAVSPGKVTTKVFNAGPSLIEALFAGEIDLGYVGPGPALNAFTKSRGEAIRIVAGGAANGVLIVARKDSGITSLEGLAGKRIATPQHANTQDIAARHYLLNVLKQADDKNVLPVTNAEQASLMERGEIDAAWAPEPWASFLVKQTGATVIAQEKDLWPDKEFSITVVVTTPEFLKKHPDTVEKLLGVHRTWTERLRTQPESQIPLLESALFDLTKKKLPAGVLQSALKNVTFTEEPLEPTLKTMAQWAFDVRIAKTVPALDGLVDTKILKKLQAAPSSQPAAASGAPK